MTSVCVEWRNWLRLWKFCCHQSTRTYFKGRTYIKIILENHTRSYYRVGLAIGETRYFESFPDDVISVFQIQIQSKIILQIRKTNLVQIQIPATFIRQSHMAVTAWIESMTRLESRWKKRWLDSDRVFQRMTLLDSSRSQWLETRVIIIFTKSLSLRWVNPVRLHTKKQRIFCFSDDQDWRKFSVLTA